MIPRQQSAKQQTGTLLFLVFWILLFVGISNTWAVSITEIYRFPQAYPGPSGPTLGGDGAFYGTCEHTGEFGHGWIYRFTTNGPIDLVASLAGTNGSLPNGGLVTGNDGALYGTCSAGGSHGAGTVFRVTTNGLVSIVVNFTGTNGSHPSAGLILGNDGNLYGTTASGGLWGVGTIFRCTTNGSVTTLHSFSDNVGSGHYPQSALMQDQDGTFFSFTSLCGEIGSTGSAFRLGVNGDLTRLITFWTTNGSAPPSEFVRGSDGSLYAVAWDGPTGAGLAVRMTQTGEQTPIASFRPAGGSEPTSALTRTSAGLIYGTTEVGGTNGVGTVFCLNSDGVLIHSVSMERSKGAKPSSPLLPAADGTFLGLAREGGEFGCGSVYRFSTNGGISLVASFANSNGAAPRGAVYLDAAGSLYGTTWSGGTANVGTLFRADMNGTITRLASFNYSNGANPEAGLIRGHDGAFYESTYYGGAYGGAYGAGAVFRGTTNGSLTALASFNPSNLGSHGRGTLVQGTNGLLYGTTFYGTSGTYGTLFRVSTNGTIAKHASFDESEYPVGPLIFGPGGLIYGTSLTGYGQYGTVFCVRTNQATAFPLTVILHGQGPYGGVIWDGANRLYGTTSWGQTNGETYGGVVFSVDVSPEMGPVSRQANACSVQFTGIPNASYQVQRAANPSGPWSNRGSRTANHRGEGNYTDFSALPTSGFYRVKQE